MCLRNLPWLNKIYYSESQSQEKAQPADNEISNAKKVVLSTKPASCRKHKLLLAIKTVCIVIIPQNHLYGFIFQEIHLYLPIQLSEGWQSCGSHPDNEVLLLTQLLCKKTSLAISHIE